MLGTDTDQGDITTHDIKDYINYFDTDLPRLANMEHDAYQDYEEEHQ